MQFSTPSATRVSGGAGQNPRVRRTRLVAFGTALVCALVAAGIGAAVPDAEVARLGADLTPVGAEKAGNKDGSIPAWSGAPLSGPAGWKPQLTRPNPYASEKPLFSITAENASKYASKLTAGQLELLSTLKGYRMDVYPTHRDCTYPDAVYQRTRENAKTAALAWDGFNLAAATGSGFPFPVPKTGAEAMWNHKLRYEGQGRIEANYTMLSPPKGGTEFERLDYVAKILKPFQSPSTKSLDDIRNIEFYILVKAVAPASLAGTLDLGIYYTNRPNEGWQYFPGQRRVRRLSTYAYDAPVSGMEDTFYTDQAYMFNGTLDRYGFKLVGKQELYIPYNTFALQDSSRFTAQSLFGRDFVNPDAMRYELHRVWKVEANVRPGQRHSSPHRVFYLDEDTWAILAEDLYDAQGKIQRVMQGGLLPIWELNACVNQELFSYDMPSGRYFGNHIIVGESEPTDWLAGAQGRLTPEMFTEDALRRIGSR